MPSISSLVLDSTDSHAHDKISSVQVQIQMVAVEPGCISSVEPVYLPGFMGVDRQPFRYTAARTAACPISSADQNSWTAPLLKTQTLEYGFLTTTD